MEILETIHKFLQNISKIEFSGAPLAVGTIVVDWFVLIFTKTIWSIYVNYKVKQYVSLKKQLEECQNRQDLRAAISIRRQIKEIQNDPKRRVSEPTFIWGFLRVVIPMIIFRNCWLCETNVRFWQPFTFMLQFPHNFYHADEGTPEHIVKIGFIYFWMHIQKIDKKIVDYFYPLNLTYSYGKTSFLHTLLKQVF